MALNFIDINKGEILWHIPLAIHPRLVAQGIRNSGMFNRGGDIPLSYARQGRQYVTVGISPNAANQYKGGYVAFALE